MCIYIYIYIYVKKNHSESSAMQWLPSLEMDTATLVQTLDEVFRSSHYVSSLGESTIPHILAPAIGKKKGSLGSCNGKKAVYSNLRLKMILCHILLVRTVWVSIYIYIYCHPKTDCFVVLQLISVAWNVGCLKLGSKPGWLYANLIIYCTAVSW